MSKPRPLVAGNWKMNGLRASLAEIDAIAKGCDPALAHGVELLVCPPATLLCAAATLCKGTAVAIGAQDCHLAPSGAHTGDLSAEMIADCGATSIIVGHSERRADHGETDAIVLGKANAVLRAGLAPIVCVGETQAEREAGTTLDIVGRQLAGSIPDRGPAMLVVAYEPVWAIGTGLTPTAADVAEVHAFIRGRLVARFGEAGHQMRILYGGSVKPSNAAELMAVANVDGALVGGASLKAADFLDIAQIYRCD
jgi:triosephosphate isomerase